MGSATKSTGAPRPRQALVRLAVRRSVSSTGGVKEVGQSGVIINLEQESEDVSAAASTGNNPPKPDVGTKRLPSMADLKSLLKKCKRPRTSDAALKQK